MFKYIAASDGRDDGTEKGKARFVKRLFADNAAAQLESVSLLVQRADRGRPMVASADSEDDTQLGSAGHVTRPFSATDRLFNEPTKGQIMFLDGNPASDAPVLSSFSSPQRRCYICGRDMLASLIAEPLMLPVCSLPECKRRAAQLPAEHCRVQRSDGSLCGAPLVRMSVDGQVMCAWHVQLTLEWHAQPLAQRIEEAA
jgi:hypothetical protein